MSNNYKHFFATFGTLIMVSLLIGSATTKQIPIKNVYTFSYVAKQAAASGSAATSIILVNPQYASTFQWKGSDLFNRYASSFASDMQAMLIARGFTLKKSGISADEIVYSDKKDADIELTIEIIPTFTATSGQWQNHSIIQGAPIWKYSGTTSLVGKINLTGIEPLTGETIWSKSLVIPEQDNIVLNTTQGYTYPLQGAQILTDPDIYNAIGAALQQSYADIMAKTETMFDPQEFQALKPQIKDLKAKAVYQGH